MDSPFIFIQIIKKSIDIKEKMPYNDYATFIFILKEITLKLNICYE